MSKRKLAIFLGILLPCIAFLAGCTTNPYTGERQVSKTAIGAGVGAAGGTLIGALAGGGKGALIGGLAGTAVGAVAGNVMDQQDKALRERLQGTGVQVVREGNNIRLIMPSDITFAINSPDIKPGFYQTLNSVAIVLRKFDHSFIKVAGFTSSTGTASFNQRLSEQRAQSVRSYLVAQGVAPRRMIAVGYGQRFPIASNKTAAGRAANRRVEVTITQN